MRKLLLSAALCCAALCVPASAAAHQPKPVTPAQEMVEDAERFHLFLHEHFQAATGRPAPKLPAWLEELLPIERTF